MKDWYKDAIFYEVHVKAFFDGDGNGIGDFAGLTAKLDYVRELGVNCLWIMPMYPSPLRDDGYDIADFYGIHPSYGNVQDFQKFMDAAHERGLRVIADLVMNHTSDQHPWFQAARADPASPFRDYYVWSDSDRRYRDARIIFTDTEKSNWAWDPAAKQYYWHRFFSHQPDLNYDNPTVTGAMLEVMRFWLNRGLDGFRCDAVPYLIEREGTSGENLPETHTILREFRRVVDLEYGGDRVLLAEANQWPEDVRPYFGDGDEFHMAFHFPLMPRLYMGIRREDRLPITDIFTHTPPIPPPCQWCLFLRNHDELTLEMVTNEERDYMYYAYASDPQMKLNLGHPAAAGPPARQRPAADRAAQLPAAHAAGQPDRLLRRRDRHGRQHPPGRSQRRPHADAVVGRPQRRLLQRRSRPALSAGDHRPRLRLPGGERRRAGGTVGLAAQHDATAHRRPPAVGGVRPRIDRVPAPTQSDRARLPASLAGRHAADRGQPLRALPAGRAGSGRAGGAVPVEMLGDTRFPPIRREPYFLSPRPARLLLVRSSKAASAVPPLRHRRHGHLMGGPTVPLGALADWIAGQRWFAAKSRRIVGVTAEDGIRLGRRHAVADPGRARRWQQRTLRGAAARDRRSDRRARRPDVLPGAARADRHRRPSRRRER